MNEATRVFVLDIESTTQPPDKGGIRAQDGMRPYLYGWKCGAATPTVTPPFSRLGMGFPEFDVIVGHNIKFDLEMADADGCTVIDNNGVGVRLSEYIRNNACIWDTQFCTYLHSGHNLQWNNLNQAAEYWGVPLKKFLDLSVELPKVNWDISKVPLLKEYLQSDVEMTWEIYQKQMEDPWVMRNIKWLLQMMDGLAGTGEIEHNGLHIDSEERGKIELEVGSLLLKTEKNIRELLVKEGYDVENLSHSSNTDLGLVLYGGTKTIVERQSAGVYKTGLNAGKPKFKNVKVPLHVHGITGISAEKAPKTTGGKVSVSHSTLEKLSMDHTIPPAAKELVELLLYQRELSKLYSTYLTGLCRYIRKGSDDKDYVYAQINTCATSTGRTSSSNPNLQNSPTGDSAGVGKIWTSRYGDKGTLLEVDYNQIEVIGLAVLSGDRQLRDDILHNVDIHSEIGKRVFGSSMSKDQRRTTKRVVFGMIYGGGAETLSAQSGLPTVTVKRIIKSFNERYPLVVEYFNNYFWKVSALLAHGIQAGYRDVPGKGKIAYNSILVPSVTGRRYRYEQSWSEFSETMCAPYTHTRNYPIQGLATGDLMLSALGKVWRSVLPKLGPEVKLVGLIHDSLRFDLPLDKLDETVSSLSMGLVDAANYLNSACPELKWDLPLKVSFSVGPNFATMREIDV